MATRSRTRAQTRTNGNAGASPDRAPRVGLREPYVSPRGSPLGLCTFITPVVHGVRHAGTKTSGIDTCVIDRVVPPSAACEVRRNHFFTVMPAKRATAPRVVCAAFRPRRKSLSE